MAEKVKAIEANGTLYPILDEETYNDLLNEMSKVDGIDRRVTDDEVNITALQENIEVLLNNKPMQTDDNYVNTIWECKKTGKYSINGYASGLTNYPAGQELCPVKGTFYLQKSTDGGTTWNDLGRSHEGVFISNTFCTTSKIIIEVNKGDKIRIKPISGVDWISVPQQINLGVALEIWLNWYSA